MFRVQSTTSPDLPHGRTRELVAVDTSPLFGARKRTATSYIVGVDAAMCGIIYTLMILRQRTFQSKMSSSTFLLQ